jgi:methionyl-tRNA synthetase
MTRTLVTMALPYANGSLHLGHMVEAIQTDVYVRARRAMAGEGEKVAFICAADQHGTPIEVNARKAGVSAEEFVTRWHDEHQRDYRDFEVAHDIFYKTHSEENRRHVERIFEALRAKGHIEKRPVEQFYCEVDKRFLPDRFVKGICPKCGAADQYGDACEKCGSTYEPTDLKDPRCAICGTPPVRRTSEHYFMLLSKSQEFLRRWTSQPGALQPEIKNFVDGWLSEKLKDWDVSREAPYFGFTIPGETDKYFYVWLDACIGYPSSTEHWAGSEFRSWWPEQPEGELEPKSGVRIEHFIGKDIVYFHTLFWPAELNASGDQRPSRVHVHGMLGIEGEKMSKSRGTFVNARQYLDAGLDPEWLRYFYAANLGPAPSDIDLSFGELKNRVNGELLNNVGNLANRSLSILWKSLQGKLGKLPADAGEQLWASAKRIEGEVKEAYLACDTRSAIHKILSLSSEANLRLQQRQPWKKLAEDPESARDELTLAINIARVCARLLAPVLPRFAAGIAEQSGAPLRWGDFTPLEGTQIAEPKPLVRRVEDADINKLTSQFTKAPPSEESKGESAKPTTESAKPKAEPKEEAPAQPINIDQFNLVDLRAGKILNAERVPKKDRLLKLTVELGEAAPRTIASGVANSYAPDELIGKTVVVVANLPPRDFGKGLVSHGMVLYSSGGKREHTAVELPAETIPGSKVK